MLGQIILPKLAGLKLKEIDRKTNRSEVLDLKIKRGADEFRLGAVDLL